MRVDDIIVQLDSDAEYMIELPFTPKGFCPLAQGCSPKAGYPGMMLRTAIFTPTGLRRAALA